MSNLVLIGMPGSGKSTCGVLAAKALCKDFADTDLLIQKAEGMPLQRIIDERGNAYFAEAEEKAICDASFRNAVVATGGSVVYSPRAMAYLKEKGVVVYLRISYETMKKRIANIATRGIILRDGETLAEMYAERAPLYEKYADFSVDCDEAEVERVVSEIVRLGREKEGK